MKTTEPGLSGGDHLAAKPTDDDEAGMDRLSVLPNSVLLHILAGLGDAATACRTSVLSSRWRRLWALLPELRFVPLSPEPGLIASALAAHEAELRHLDVTTQDAAPEPVAAWLRVAARRLSGSLVFTNQTPMGRDDGADADGEKRSAFDERPRRRGAARDDVDVDDAQGRGAFELPCLDRATSVSLDLGRLGLTVPRAGAFARLTELSLSRARLPAAGGGPCTLGDAVSSRRCPSLQTLTVSDVWGLEDLTVRSDSLRRMELIGVRDLRRLAVVAPALEHLQVLACFYHHSQRRPVATITARQLKVLKWGDLFDRRSVQLGKMKHLRKVCLDLFFVYAFSPNQGCLELLRCFNNIQKLGLTLVYPPEINNKPCLLKDMKMLPGVTALNLDLISNGHAFGASIFHVLRLCSGTRKLTLHISSNSLEEQTACPPGCICDEQQDWKFEELLLNHLQEVEITELRGSEQEVIFLKHLLSWATELKKMTIFFNSLVTESIARKSYQIIRRFSRREICMEFYMDKDTVMVPYVPKDKITS